jgi:ankyrin repeat protein
MNSVKCLILVALLLTVSGLPARGQEMVTADDVVAAATQFDIHSVRKLLKQNPQAVNEIGSDGESPLSGCLIAQSGTAPQAKLDCVRFLLDQGADPNLRVGGVAPLELAMLMDIELVKLLLNAGADPNNAAEDGLTPIDTAQGLHGETADEIRALLEKKAD